MMLSIATRVPLDCPPRESLSLAVDRAGWPLQVRTTFLPPADQLEGVTKAIAAFHTAFLEEYASVHAQQ